jgi:riboflavin kinase/FMN adenylyltransferase
MRIIRDGQSLGPDEHTAVGIGMFDGVHLGHRHVLAHVRADAERRGLLSAVVTFDRHPAYVVRPEYAPRQLTTLEQKLELLEQNGIDVVYVVHFDEAVAATSAADFVDEVLVDALHARCLVVGADFHFGKGREGDVPRLSELGTQRGFGVHGLELIRHTPEAPAITSTAIRAALTEGDVAHASALLGRPYEVCGIVAHGDKRGRTIGFPTANVPVDGETAMPADGVYAGWFTRADGTVHPAAISLGRRPTFYVEQDQSLLEAYLLDFSDDLYDEVVRVSFVGRCRGQVKFDSIESLVAQMGRDVERTRTFLAGA